MQNNLVYVESHLPFLSWSVQDNLLFARNHSLIFRILDRNHLFEASIFSNRISRNLFVSLEKDLPSAVVSLKVEIEELRKAFDFSSN